ncbi:MAG: VPLPA-CTERM-specific exosortase XrtD [Desulfobacterales bacterium]|nr:VPLPA-CTERM-specific exosortase XrtD [Desulfobacterales bacterium]
MGYWPVFQKMMIRWNMGDNSYCYLVVPIFIYLCWELKDQFRFHQFSFSAWGIPPVLASVGILVAGELGSIESLLFIGIWGGITGVIITAYGWKRSLSLWFPLLILAFIVPMPPFINQMLTFKMKMAASSISVDMMRAIGMTVLQDGNVIDLGTVKLEVVDACSGLRYIMSMFMMALLIGHFFMVGWWRKVLLLFFVFPLSILLNSCRIFISGILSVNGYQSFTAGAFHDGAGLVAFLLAGLFLYLLARGMMKVGRVVQTPDRVDPGGRAVPGYKIALISICISVLFAGSGWALQNMASIVQKPERQSFEAFPMEIAGWQGKREYLSEEIMNSLWADDYVNAVFTRPDSRNAILLLIPYYEYQGTRHTVHAPQSCLLGGGWDMMGSGTQKLSVPGREIEIGFMNLQKDNRRMLASYFFLQRGRVLTSPWMNKLYLMRDAVEKRRTDGALVRVELLMPKEGDIKAAQAQLRTFIQELWPVLGTYVPN